MEKILKFSGYTLSERMICKLCVIFLCLYCQGVQLWCLV